MLKIVVEKQVNSNVVAMCIQSCIITYALINEIDIIIFDPKNKFTFTGQTYNSTKKEHKKLAIKYTLNLLQAYHKDKLALFEQYKKQDDISDSILMNFMVYPNTDLDKLKNVLLGKL